jgi:hypothetical protein
MVKPAEPAPAPNASDAALDELYRLPPEEFTAARNASVKALKKAGQRERAAEVAAWRRPSPTDWALNVVAVEHDEAVASLLDAAAAARDAQAAAIEGRAGGDLRETVAALREAVTRVVALAEDVLSGAGRDPAPQRAALSARLSAIATQPVLGEQLRAARLGSGDAAPEDLFADLEPAAPRPRAPSLRPAEPRGKPEAVPPLPPRPDRRELRQALTAAQRAQRTAATAAERAAARVEKAQAEVRDAERRLADAQEALATAEAEQAERDAELAESGEAVDAAQAALDDT